MQNVFINIALGRALAVALVLAATPAWADPPEGKGKGWGKGKGNERAEQQASPAKAPPAPAAGSYFIDRHRAEVRTYYAAEQRRGSCPPGLAKKNNGCMPPGQAKKWQVGRPLPRDVVIYDLPPALVIKIGVPPAGHKYVRVAADVLLIAIGTSMVVDAIRDLGQL